MPTYDYRCLSCQGEFEARHGMSAPAPRCVICGGASQRLLRAPPAVHGKLARGRELAAQSLPECGKGCRCCP